LKNDEISIDIEIAEEESLPLFAKDKAFGWLLIVGGLISWISSGALVLDRLKIYADPSAVVSCDVNSWIACGQVMRTPQAALFGFPNPLIGIAAFVVLITLGVVLAAGVKLPKPIWVGLQVGMSLGIGLIGWFWYTALYTIGVLCPYCMVVWAMMIPMFLWTTSRNILNDVIPASSGIKRIFSMWTTPAVIGVYLLVVSSIIVRFGALMFGAS
jgi:uncharacterized membrane protein